MRLLEYLLSLLSLFRHMAEGMVSDDEIESKLTERAKRIQNTPTVFCELPATRAPDVECDVCEIIYQPMTKEGCVKAPKPASLEQTPAQQTADEINTKVSKECTFQESDSCTVIWPEEAQIEQTTAVPAVQPIKRCKTSITKEKMAPEDLDWGRPVTESTNVKKKAKTGNPPSAQNTNTPEKCPVYKPCTSCKVIWAGGQVSLFSALLNLPSTWLSWVTCHYLAYHPSQLAYRSASPSVLASFLTPTALMQVNSEKKALLEPSEKSTAKTSKKETASSKRGGARRRMPKKATEDEFAKGPLGWVSTLLYLSMVWVIGLSFAAGMLFLNKSRLTDVPVYFGANSFIGNTPRILFEPNPARNNVTNKAVVYFVHNNRDESNTHNLLVRYQELVKEYQLTDRAKEGRVLCSDFNGNEDGRPVNTSCIHTVDDEVYGPCALTMENILQTAMGLAEKMPCIMLRFNRLIGWFPDVLSSSNRTCPSGKTNCCHRHHVNLKCEGANYTMYPKDGMDTCGFPFWNQPGYQSPFVMLKFNLTQAKGVTEVTCKSKDLKRIDENQNKLVFKFHMDEHVY